MAIKNSYYIDVSHDGLKKLRRIKGADKLVVEQIAARQIALWNEQWSKKQHAQHKQAAREKNKLQKLSRKEAALEQTRDAQEALQEIEDILKHALNKDVPFTWESLLKNDAFSEPQPTKPSLQEIPRKPAVTDSSFLPEFNFFDYFVSSWKLKKIEDARQRFNNAVAQWELYTKAIDETNMAAEELYRQKMLEWQRHKDEYLRLQNLYNDSVEACKIAYEEKEGDAIAEYSEYVLSASKYPDYFSGEWELEYNKGNRLLIIESNLPPPDAMPSLKEVKYIQSRDDYQESYISDTQAKKQYESAIYKVALRTLYELFEADYKDALSSVVFNGWVRSIDKATGREVTACVLSIQTSKDEFLKINLAQVDPKTCFKSLKGVSCSTLHSLTPIAPILRLNREDSRFISSYAVAESLDTSTNLAAMDWEDFEHLIRELFEKEFSQSGGEVKVTQASRDGGVDAVAFDPDPIRGGKIVIQAKRYTNTVGVAAVRDLYGTLLNEGAGKGILVTTSDYGSDAYDFAKGKPITLLNGANLLHLLSKHGHQAKMLLIGAIEPFRDRRNGASI